MPVLTPDGRRASAGGWIYQTQMLSLFVVDPPEESAGELVFVARRTLFVVPQANGSTALLRADRQGTKPTEIRVPAAAVVFRHDVTSDEFLRNCATELSSLTIAERVN